jgi:hypothetical protein
MITQKSQFKKEKELAEKMRIALEQDLGMAIPTPKCLSKRHSLFR